MESDDFGGGAFGASAAGGTQDPISFMKRPTVIARSSALLAAIIVFGCVSSQGWQYDQKTKTDLCIMNHSASCCHFATFVGLVGFVAACAFIAGEWFFEQMSSLKSRKHYVIGDMGFSAVWAFFFFIAFAYMSFSWGKTTQEYEYGSGNILGAIFFAFVSIICWASCAFLSFKRYQSGIDSAFTSQLGAFEETGDDDDGYQGYGQTEDSPGNNDGGGGGGYQRQPDF